MTPAECAIVAECGASLKRMAEILTVPSNIVLVSDAERQWVRLLDKTAMQLAEVYGALATLPLVEA